MLSVEQPKGPKGGKRPADVIANAAKVMQIATAEEPEEIDAPKASGKDPAAVSMGKRGGKARAERMTPERRAEIAKKAAALFGMARSLSICRRAQQAPAQERRSCRDP
jgi:hypothetical protein